MASRSISGYGAPSPLVCCGTDRTVDDVTDRDLLSAAAHAIRTRMKRRQAAEQAVLLETDPSAWAPPDPELETLAVEIDA